MLCRVDEFHNFRHFFNDIPFDFLKLHHSLYMSLHGTWLQLTMAHGDREAMLKWYQVAQMHLVHQPLDVPRGSMRIYCIHSIP